MTIKSLPRDLTPEMVEAQPFRLRGFLSRAPADGLAVEIYQAMYDAAPSSLPLKRTEPPTTSGLYWARLQPDRKDKSELGRPGILSPVYAMVVPGRGFQAVYAGQPWPTTAFDWFGERIPIPEVEP